MPKIMNKKLGDLTVGEVLIALDQVTEDYRRRNFGTQGTYKTYEFLATVTNTLMAVAEHIENNPREAQGVQSDSNPDG